MIDCLEAGSTYINTFNLAPAELPFGGYKMSGLGRENGPDGLNNYLETKAVTIKLPSKNT